MYSFHSRTRIIAQSWRNYLSRIYSSCTSEFMPVNAFYANNAPCDCNTRWRPQGVPLLHSWLKTPDSFCSSKQSQSGRATDHERNESIYFIFFNPSPSLYFPFYYLWTFYKDLTFISVFAHKMIIKTIKCVHGADSVTNLAYYQIIQGGISIKWIMQSFF